MSQQQAKLDLTEVGERARDFVQQILDEIGVEAQTSMTAAEGLVIIQILGEDLGLILGDSARLLYALNHLVNQIFYRQSRNGCNFLLDCNNYRSDRTAELELMAEKAAEKARISGAKISLQPMPSSERRIIHLALANRDGVRTESEGSGRFRRVLIIPSAAR